MFRSRIDVDKGRFVKIAVNHEVIQLLGDDGSCVQNTMGSSETDTFDNCMYHQMSQIMTQSVNCTVPWMPNKDNICKGKSDREKAFDIYQKNRRNQKDICPNSCLFTNMYFGPPVTGFTNAEDSDEAHAIFYFRRDIKTTSEYYLYSLLSMLAEIGGYVGLLLGASLFKLANINNVCIDWFALKAKNVREDFENRLVPNRR